MQPRNSRAWRKPASGISSTSFPTPRSSTSPARIQPGDVDDLGVTVDLYLPDEDKELRYQVVGEEEANLREGRISIASPIARALIGKSEGDEITVQAPGGERVYELLKVSYI